MVGNVPAGTKHALSSSESICRETFDKRSTADALSLWIQASLISVTFLRLGRFPWISRAYFLLRGGCLTCLGSL